MLGCPDGNAEEIQGALHSPVYDFIWDIFETQA
jgi:hypothetical protein